MLNLLRYLNANSCPELLTSAIARLLILSILYCLSACSTQQSDTIRFGLSAAPATLVPRYATDAASDRITRLIYRRLVDFDGQANFVPALASWQRLTARHYRFTLGNEGRLFHNGTILTATDVKATYDFVLNPDNASPHRDSIAVIDNIKLIDDNTIDFHLHRADPIFPGRLVIGILPEVLMLKAHAFNQLPVGSGPLKFIEWPSEERLSLQRISDKQFIDFITVKDPTVRVLKLLRAEIDLLQGELPHEMIAWLANKQAVDISQNNGSNFSYIGFNLEDADTSKLMVRKAIACAIDRQKIIHYALGKAARLAGSIFPPEHWAADPGLTGYAYNPDESKRLLLKAGYSRNKPLSLNYKTSTNPVSIRFATIIQQQLKQVGIELEIHSHDWGTFYGDIKAGRFQMYSLSWVGIKMPDVFRYIFHSVSIPPAGANRGRFDDAIMDQLIEQAEAEETLSVRTDIYRAIQQRLHQQLPYIPLWYEDNVLVKRKQISGYTLAADGNYDGLINIQRKPQEYDR